MLWVRCTSFLHAASRPPVTFASYRVNPMMTFVTTSNMLLDRSACQYIIRVDQPHGSIGSGRAPPEACTSDMRLGERFILGRQGGGTSWRAARAGLRSSRTGTPASSTRAPAGRPRADPDPAAAAAAPFLVRSILCDRAARIRALLAAVRLRRDCMHAHGYQYQQGRQRGQAPKEPAQKLNSSQDERFPAGRDQILARGPQLIEGRATDCFKVESYIEVTLRARPQAPDSTQQACRC